MWLVVGLGNPGPRYERTPHNIGFRVVDRLAERHRIGGFRDKHGGQLATGTIRDTRVLLLKPMQYMNLSGHAVQRAAAFHKVPAERIVVVHDEIDFPFGRVRVKSGGGHGGHNGLRSILEQLGEDGFQRVRCGVGRPDRDHGPRVRDFLLSDFPADVEPEVDALTDRAADAVEAVVTDGVRNAMNRFNAM
ncbi:MAG: aminoacyl-tRNA hydrolase [Deltaproteobacteria bacterium]|nr:MAG: aminoacyl-tRNA hydrolase [Deltaproteobacteria bacterium]